MSLPTIPLATASVKVGDVDVNIRSLARSEVVHLGTLSEDTDEAEIYVLSCGTGETQEAAKAWRETTDTPTVAALLAEIAVLSGLRPMRAKSGN